jgi:type IV secretion system protein TrbF
MQQQEQTPYLIAREEWNERYGSYIARARNWRWAAILALISNGVLAVGCVYIGCQSKYIPYIVETDRLGQVTHVARIDQTQPTRPKNIQAFLMRFIEDWRSVSSDPVVQKQRTDRLYQFLANGTIALQKINAFYRDHSPFTVGQSETVAIELTGAPLALSELSWQAEWWETRRNLNGERISRLRYKAVLTVAVDPPQDGNTIFNLINPLGLFVTDADWSQQL